MRQPRIILLEFNELCPSLLDQWMSEGKLPHFKSFYQNSQVFIAEADSPATEHLEPWIQWYSMHTGLPFQQHGVFHLTDGPAAGHADLWKMLSDSGLTVASCASMNVRGFTTPGCFFLPDPWCASEDPFPPELNSYQTLIRSQVQENSNSTTATGK